MHDNGSFRNARICVIADYAHDVVRNLLTRQHGLVMRTGRDKKMELMLLSRVNNVSDTKSLLELSKAGQIRDRSDR